MEMLQSSRIERLTVPCNMWYLSSGVSGVHETPKARPIDMEDDLFRDRSSLVIFSTSKNVAQRFQVLC